YSQTLAPGQSVQNATQVYPTMTQALLEQRTEQALMAAREYLIKHGSLIPVLQILCKETAIIFALADQGAVDRIPEIIKKYRADADAFIFVTEGWVKDLTNTHRIGEVIQVAAVSRTGKYCGACVFTRDTNDVPQFAEPMFSTEFYSRHLDGAF
ncbi:MAG: hypothetical protein JZU65_09120, partial [Chlorobium sp.]|nr:hypothetical protein [Chlorobium sp.]